jgi:hypothetical protein
VAVIAVVRVTTMNGMGMAVVLQEMIFCMANTHSVFANAHHDVPGDQPRKSALKVDRRRVAPQLRIAHSASNK